MGKTSAKMGKLHKFKLQNRCSNVPTEGGDDMEKSIAQNELELEVYYNGVPQITLIPTDILDLLADCFEEIISCIFKIDLESKQNVP